ncbi:helix-turn-helix domain-containing protein [uncultured Thiodictyon sp.]|uniref:helix-turn-helix domain-containing protein n=1 Tax=uncultured Thiodictyon sp. TaxID=1846217 RepID=UPI0025FCB794|nr:helix-turn-helix domain-containing protein [uncultured Thiodictyon sp.]
MKLGRAVTGVPVKAMDALCAYGWPGNIRELEDVIERALILSSGTTLVLGELVDLHPAAPADAAATKPTGLTLEEAERHHICTMLEQTCWQIEARDGAAQRLNINASTLRSRMRRLGIERPRAQGAAGGRRT